MVDSIPIGVGLINLGFNRHPFSKAKILSSFGALVGVSLLVTDGYLAKIMATAAWNTTRDRHWKRQRVNPIFQGIAGAGYRRADAATRLIKTRTSEVLSTPLFASFRAAAIEVLQAFFKVGFNLMTYCFDLNASGDERLPS